jgi:hypothetical protein
LEEGYRLQAVACAPLEQLGPREKCDDARMRESAREKESEKQTTKEKYIIYRSLFTQLFTPAPDKVV